MLRRQHVDLSPEFCDICLHFQGDFFGCLIRCKYKVNYFKLEYKYERKTRSNMYIIEKSACSYVVLAVVSTIICVCNVWSLK
jgi:hypothetical protein